MTYHELLAIRKTVQSYLLQQDICSDIGMDPQTNKYFTNLMQSASNEDIFIMEPQCFDPSAQVTTQETPVTSPIETMSKKQQRGGNFTIEEDKLLTSAWLNISMDAIKDTINIGDDNVPADDVVDMERQAGRKAEKARLKKQKNEEIVSTGICLALDKIRECKSKLTDKKLEMYEKLYDQEEEKLRIKREMLEMKQFKEDERVMTMDLNCLPEEQQEFYKLKRLEILG